MRGTTTENAADAVGSNDRCFGKGFNTNNLLILQFRLVCGFMNNHGRPVPCYPAHRPFGF